VFVFSPEIPIGVPTSGAEIMELNMLPRLQKAIPAFMLTHTLDGDDTLL
jgi:hypothetical protein